MAIKWQSQLWVIMIEMISATRWRTLWRRVHAEGLAYSTITLRKYSPVGQR